MKPRCRNRGSVLAEFALSFGLLVVLLTGVVRAGCAFYVYGQLLTAVGNGARYAAIRSYRSSAPGAYTTAVTNMVVYGDPNPAGGASPIVSGLTAGNVTVRVNLAAGRPHDVTISIHGFPIAAVFAAFTLNGKPSANFPYAGCSS